MIVSQWNSFSGDMDLRIMEFQDQNLARFRINIREPDLMDYPPFPLFIIIRKAHWILLILETQKRV